MNRTTYPDFAFAYVSGPFKLLLHHDPSKVIDGNDHDSVNATMLDMALRTVDFVPIFEEDEKEIREEIREHLTAHVNKTDAAKWTRKYINDLPDAAFAVIEEGGEKDEEGRTKPRNLRHLPHHDSGVKSSTENSSVDLPHLRNALARMNQIKPSSSEDSAERLQSVASKHLIAHAKELLPNSKWAKGEILGAQAKIVEIKEEASRVVYTVFIENEDIGQWAVTFIVNYNAEKAPVAVEVWDSMIPVAVLPEVVQFLKNLPTK